MASLLSRQLIKPTRPYLDKLTREHSKDSEHDVNLTQKRNDAGDRAYRKRIAETLEAILEYKKAEKTQINSREEFKWLLGWLIQWKQYRITVINTALAAFGVAAAFLAGLFALGQLSVMRGQLTELQKQSALTISQLGPKLGITFSKIEATKQINGLPKPGWLITPTWVNHGGTEAIGFHGWDKLHIFVGDDTSQFDLVNPGVPVPETGGLSVTPTDVGMLASLFISNDDLTSAMEQKGVVLIWGYLEYADTLPDSSTRQVHWCYQVVPSKSANGFIFSFPIYKSVCNSTTTLKKPKAGN